MTNHQRGMRPRARRRIDQAINQHAVAGNMQRRHRCGVSCIRWRIAEDGSGNRLGGRNGHSRKSCEKKYQSAHRGLPGLSSLSDLVCILSAIMASRILYCRSFQDPSPHRKECPRCANPRATGAQSFRGLKQKAAGPQVIMLIVSCVTVSNVVMALELASNARCAMIRLENSAEMFTFDASRAPSWMLPNPLDPAVPIEAVPLARVVP